MSSYQKINDETLDYFRFPRKRIYMRTLAREFKFAEDLLVFLSQRKEEASISYVSVLPNLKVLSYGFLKYSLFHLKEILFIRWYIIGFLIPFGIFFY